jgi:hypothetical protein
VQRAERWIVGFAQVSENALLVTGMGIIVADGATSDHGNFSNHWYRIFD